jgi:hypothetical protein
MIHIEGMGVLGSLLALRLDHEGIKFTWNDIDAPRTAWKACTGAIFPCGEAESVDWLAYNDWRDELEKPTWTKPVSRHFERGVYTFNHQRPPHDGKYEFSNLGNTDLRFPLLFSSYHVNAQTLVPAVRKRFASRQVVAPNYKQPHVVAHGFGKQMTHVYWGWTRKVELDYKFKTSDRPAFYFRQGRYVMAYAYPVPGTPHWYAGSSIIMQRTLLKELLMPPKYERWRDWFEELSGGAVRVKRTREGEFLQGWRPAEENPDVYHDKRNKTIRMPSLWNSGVRHAPYYIDAVLEIIRHAHYR